MKKILTLILLSITFIILDNAFAPFIAVKGMYPSFLFVFAICFSIKNGRWDAIVIGIITGIFQDLYFFNGFGLNCLVNMLLCFLASLIGERFYKDNLIVPAGVSFVLSFLKIYFTAILLVLIGKYNGSANALYFSIYNTFLAVFIYVFVYNLSEREYMKEDWNFKNRG